VAARLSPATIGQQEPVTFKRAVERLRAKPACWLLAAVVAVVALLAAAPPSGFQKGGQTNPLAPWARSAQARKAGDTNASVLPAVPRPTPAHRAELPAAFTKAVPVSIADLKSIERHVKALAARVSPAVVAVEIGIGSGSGVVISADGLVLTAGHVCGSPGRSVLLTFPDGKTVRGKTLGVNRETDTGLIKINDRGPWPYAAMGDLEQTRAGDWALALGHPGGFDLKRSLVVRLGRVIRLAEDALQTDCTISPGDSGGPLFDMHGRVIGIHSAISSSVADNFHVAVTEFYKGWDTPSATEPAGAQEAAVSPVLGRNRFRSGEETLRAFAPVSAATRQSIVKFNVDGATVALGTVMDTNGLALTKASELKPGKLTCWLATDQEVAAEVIGLDEEEDVALVRVHARGLKPIRWAAGEVSIGQWAITPGIPETPHAVGIISALPRRIRPPRALIGIRFDFGTSAPRIEQILPGLGAEKAGLKSGDLILAVNGTAVTNREQVVETLREFRDGQSVKLSLRRAEKQFDAQVRMMVPTSGQSGSDLYSRPRFSRVTGEVSRRADGFEQAIEHDSVLHPWLCGGPLVNLEGEAIGLNIARAGRVTTYALPARLANRIFEHLRPNPKATTAN